MKSFKVFLFNLLIIVFAVVVMALWFLGVPYLVHRICNVDYFSVLSLWLGIYLIENIFRRVVAERDAKKYRKIKKVLEEYRGKI